MSPSTQRQVFLDSSFATRELTKKPRSSKAKQKRDSAIKKAGTKQCTTGLALTCHKASSVHQCLRVKLQEIHTNTTCCQGMNGSARNLPVSHAGLSMQLVHLKNRDGGVEVFRAARCGFVDQFTTWVSFWDTRVHEYLTELLPPAQTCNSFSHVCKTSAQ